MELLKIIQTVLTYENEKDTFYDIPDDGRLS
jgi:hypothetical protein